MKVAVDAEEFAAAVKNAAGIARGTHALSALLLDASSDGSFVITGGDGDIFAEFTIKGVVSRSGRALVSARVLANAAPKFDGQVLLTLDDDDVMAFETLTSRLRLPTIDVDEYPKITWEAGQRAVISDFWESLKLISYVSRMDQEPAWRAVRFLSDGWAETYDKTRLARTAIPEGLEAGIPKDAFEFAGRVIPSDSQIMVSATKDLVVFQGAGVRVRSTTVQLDLRSAIPPGLNDVWENSPSFTCDRKALLEAIGLIEVVKTADQRTVGTQPIRVDIEDGMATLSARSPDVGEVVSTFAVEGDLPWPVGLSSGYVKDVLLRCSGEKVTFQFGSSDRHPIKVESDDVLHMFGPNMAAVKG